MVGQACTVCGAVANKEPPHLLDGHQLSYCVLAGDTVLHSEVVPAREALVFNSFTVPPHIRQVELVLVHYDPLGIGLSLIRRVVHPATVRASLNTLPYKMLEDYLAPIISRAQGR
jgi:hypothetical protein